MDFPPNQVHTQSLGSPKGAGGAFPPAAPGVDHTVQLVLTAVLVFVAIAVAAFAVIRRGAAFFSKKRDLLLLTIAYVLFFSIALATIWYGNLFDVLFLPLFGGLCAAVYFAIKNRSVEWGSGKEWPMLVAIAAFILSLLVLGAIWRGHNSFEGIGTVLESSWGVAIGILATILVGSLIAVIPSRVEGDVRAIVESLQAPLSDFQIIRRRAFELLKEAGDDKDSRFLMIAATPVFGLELPDGVREQWKTELFNRITKGLETRILCWDWNDTEGVTHSSLGRFCIALAKLLSNTLPDPPTARDLIVEAWKYFEDFILPASRSSTHYSLKLINEPPFGLILSDNGRGKANAILYFASNQIIAASENTRGLIVGDKNILAVVEETFRSLEKLGRSVEDGRTPDQKKRDEELFERFRQISPSGQGSKTGFRGFELELDPDVFPPDASCDTASMAQTIATLLAGPNKIDVKPQDLVGFDIGTGSGALALELAKHCATVYASDTSRAAVALTRRNFQANEPMLRQSLGQTPNFVLRLGALLDEGDIGAHESKTRIVVFNQPMYPTPHNVFGTGGPGAGLEVLKQFFATLNSYVKDKKKLIVVLPANAAYAGNHDPRSAASGSGFQEIEVADSVCGNEAGNPLKIVIFYSADCIYEQQIRALSRPPTATSSPPSPPAVHKR